MSRTYRGPVRPIMTGRTTEHVSMFGNPLLRVCPKCDAPKYVRCSDVRRGQFRDESRKFVKTEYVYVRDTSHAER